MMEPEAEAGAIYKTRKSPTNLGKTARLRGGAGGNSFWISDRPNHFGLLSLVVYIIGRRRFSDLLGRNKTHPPPRTFQSDGLMVTGGVNATCVVCPPNRSGTIKSMHMYASRYNFLPIFYVCCISVAKGKMFPFSVLLRSGETILT